MAHPLEASEFSNMIIFINSHYPLNYPTTLTIRYGFNIVLTIWFSTCVFFMSDMVKNHLQKKNTINPLEILWRSWLGQVFVLGPRDLHLDHFTKAGADGVGKIWRAVSAEHQQDAFLAGSILFSKRGSTCSFSRHCWFMEIKAIMIRKIMGISVD